MFFRMRYLSARYFCGGLLVLALLAPLLAAAPAPAAPDFSAIARQATLDLAAGHYAAVERHFDAQMKASLPAAQLAAFWSSLTAHLGAFQRITTVDSSVVNGVYHNENVGAAFAHKTLGLLWSTNPQGEIVGLFTVAPPSAQQRTAAASPPPYRSKNVAFSDGPVRLAGTLTLPDGVRDPPAVVLIAGSGPLDRNETMPWGFQPFRALADFLSRHGFAVLRYDKRGVGQSTGDLATATTLDFAHDAEAAAAFLRRQPELDRRAIGLIGHSEGGEIAPMVAARDPKIAFIVLMGGQGQNGAAILREQYALAAQAREPATIPVDAQMIAKAFALDKSGQSFASLRPLETRLVSLQLRAHGLDSPRAMRAAETAAWRQMDTPWMRFFLTYNPASALERVHCPVLALAGSHDQQVPPGPNLAAIRAALTAGQNRNFKIVELPGLNHLFQNSPTGAVAEYRTLPPKLSPALYHTLLPWLRAQARAASRR